MDDPVMEVVKSFTSLMDGRSQWPAYDLSDSAVLDWFGRTVRGRSAILNFVKTHFPQSKHIVRTATRIPPVTHRLIKPNRGNSVTPAVQKPVEDERLADKTCDGGSHTPDNPIRVDSEQLLRAPNAKIRSAAEPSTDQQDWDFVEIRAKLTYEQDYEQNGAPCQAGKLVDRIVLGYSDAIHFLAYESSSMCRKRLFPLYSETNEEGA